MHVYVSHVYGSLTTLVLAIQALCGLSPVQEINILSYLKLDIAADQGPEPADTLCANTEILATYWSVLDKKGN